MKFIKKLVITIITITAINVTNAQCDFEITTLAEYCDEGEITSVLYAGKSLSTTFEAGNGQNGNMFDVFATNEVIITGFDIHLQGNTTMEVYYRAESYVGYDSSSAGWTLIGSTEVIEKPQGTPTYLPLMLNVNIPVGETYSFYVTSNNNSVNISYTNGTTVGTVYTSDDNIQIYEGIGIEYPFGTTYSPRVFNGTVRYELPEINYLWNEGGVSSYLEVSPNVVTTYSVIVSDDLNTCISNEGIEVSTINAIDNTISEDSPGLLSSNQLGQVTYQWYQCPNTLLPGEEGRYFDPIEAGDYKVIVSDGCKSIESSCYTISAAAALSVAEIENEEVKIYPNPISDVLNVKVLEETRFTLFNQLGQQILVFIVDSGELAQENMSNLDKGVYVLRDDKGNSYKIFKK